MENYINRGNKATKVGFGEGVLEAAKKNRNVVGIGADITASVGMSYFADAYYSKFKENVFSSDDAGEILYKSRNWKFFIRRK